MASRPGPDGAVLHQHRLDPPAALADRLARLGFQTSAEELVTPVAVAERLFAASPEARVLAVAADEVRQLLDRFLAGPGTPATHVLVADPSYGATYDDLDAPSGPCGPGPSWSPPR